MQFKPSRPDWIVGRRHQPKKEIELGDGRSLTLPDGYLRGQLATDTEYRKVTVLAVGSGVTEDIRPGMVVYVHELDRQLIDKDQYPDIEQIPEEKILAIVEEPPNVQDN